jgi:regulator of sigma E protease
LNSPGVLVTVLSFLLVIGPLIFVHELGHYFAGRWFGVKADAFSIGFGREVAGWTDKRGTRWKIGWLPLGGYVKFAGDMNPASTPSDEWLSLPPEERNKTFQSKPVWQRFIIVAAGPFVNFLFAILAFMAIFAAIGYPTTPPVLTGIIEGQPAARAGFQPGDRILTVEGRAVETFTELQEYIRIRPNQQLDFLIERDGRQLPISAQVGATTMRDQFGNGGPRRSAWRRGQGRGPAGRAVHRTARNGDRADSEDGRSDGGHAGPDHHRGSLVQGNGRPAQDRASVGPASVIGLAAVSLANDCDLD